MASQCRGRIACNTRFFCPELVGKNHTGPNSSWRHDRHAGTHWLWARNLEGINIWIRVWIETSSPLARAGFESMLAGSADIDIVESADRADVILSRTIHPTVRTGSCR